MSLDVFKAHFLLAFSRYTLLQRPHLRRHEEGLPKQTHIKALEA